MAVECPRCRRQYDVALFQFGRTISCACGSRVGAEVLQRGVEAASPPRFAADAMLGSLARWLRLMGFDCSYQADIPDAVLVEQAIHEERVVLTRDRALVDEWHVSGIHRVRAERTFDQLSEVLRAFDLVRSLQLFSRCSACNRPIGKVSLEAVRDRVPPRVAANQSEFWQCPGCGRVYWQGSHTDRIRRVAEQLLAEC